MMCRAIHTLLCAMIHHSGVAYKSYDIQAPSHMTSPSASPQGQGHAVNSPALSQSSPQQPLSTASDPPQGAPLPSQASADAIAHSEPQQGGDQSGQQQLLPGGITPTAHSQTAAQHAQHAGQGSARHGGHPRRQGQQHMGQSYQHQALVSSLVMEFQSLQIFDPHNCGLHIWLCK